MRTTKCNGKTRFAENKLYELYNLYHENKGLICGGLVCGEMEHFEKLGCRNIFLAHSQKFRK